MGRTEAEFFKFKEVGSCDYAEGRDEETVVSCFGGSLLRKESTFPYFLLVAFEAGGYLRACLLVLMAPLAYLLSHFVSESAGMKVLIFVSTAGLKVKRIQAVARAVLPRFYCDDIHPETWRVFSSFGKRLILTSTPRIMVEVFAREFLGADATIGTELQTTRGGRATGLVHEKRGVLVGEAKAKALMEALASEKAHVGIGHRHSDHSFLKMCKEGYVVPKKKIEALPKERFSKVIVFHDGRFVRRPTPMVALLTLLWCPIGFFLAIVRISMGALPFRVCVNLMPFVGVRMRVRGTPPPPAMKGKSGVLFVCNHRSCADPIFLALALGRQVPALTYSLSRVSEILSPIKTVRMARDRQKDSELIRKSLEVGDLFVCPEGTTCREPFLLRFSAMFADLTDEIVPVAMNARQNLFYGSTVNGWKGMDAFFFFMNPFPHYELTFLNKLPQQFTRAGGKSSYEVANYIQRAIAGTLNFDSTNFTRKDKYRMLAGNDGIVSSTF